MWKPPTFYVLVGALGMTLASAAGAQPDQIEYAGYDRALAWGNGNKMEVGFGNSLHAVFTQNGQIVYATSPDGDNWPTQSQHLLAQNVFGGNGVVDSPALAVDGSGRVWVVWRESDGAQASEIHLAFKDVNASSFTYPIPNQAPLVLGKQPAITARGTIVDIAWSTGNSIQHHRFATTTPPTSTVALGDMVELTSCPNTELSLPAIATVRDVCDTVPSIAYLVVSDERDPSSPCFSPDTRAGAIVETLNGGWTMVFDGTVPDALPGAVAGHGLSLASHYERGDLYLAWSDENGAGSRTMLAQGRGANWVSTLHEAAAHHVHLRANNFNWAAPGEFRLALSDPQGFDWNASSQVGQWANAGALSWTGAPQNISPFRAAAFPQAQFWRRCSFLFPTYHRLSLYFEDGPAQMWDPAMVATDYWNSLWESCSKPPLVLLRPPCTLHRNVVLAGMTLESGEGTVVDVSELGWVSAVSDTEATVTTHGGGRLTVRWAEGSLLDADETVLRLTAPRGAVTFKAEGVELEVVDLGLLAGG